MDDRNSFVQVETAHLRERLNRFYFEARTTDRQITPTCFDHLWDLKEMAMVEGLPTVLVPQGWLEEVEQFESQLIA